MISLLLPIIYLAFISLGLPDSLLGSAWPSMHVDIAVPVSYGGVISMIIGAGTVVSSLLSGWLHARFGTGRITAVSVLITAGALWGFSLSPSFELLCLCAIPYGLGAGSVDAALNNYVALHYKARHMSWLHCMWGVGCSIGPLIMSRAIAGGSWQTGYGIIAGLQAVLTLILFISLPLWKERSVPTDGEKKPVTASLGKLLRLPGIYQVMICFFCYCALETTAGMWAASYCTLYRGISTEQATAWASLFYIGITLGRAICGFITFKLNDRSMIRLGQAIVGVGIILTLIPAGNAPLVLGLICMGLGCAPIYPSIIHETPQNFGASNSQGVIGLQMASAYVGSTLMAPLFGLLAERISFGLYPIFMLVILMLMWVMAEWLHRKTAVQV